MRVVRISILITGASGFLGRTLADELKDNFDLMLTTRTDGNLKPGRVYLDLSNLENLSAMFDGVDTVVHTAALVHQINPEHGPTRARFFSINTSATLQLAGAASEMGVKHFIFISSVKVNGEGGLMHKP